VAGAECLDETEVELEQLYLGLRTREGVPARQLPSETTDPWLSAGWAERWGERLRLTPEGWLRLDALTAAVG
jgi:coproporphyrinogen III oxidase-like Fe-S oxidoreductase